MPPMPEAAGHRLPRAVEEERLAWLALKLAPGLGPKRVLDAVRCLESPGHLFDLSLTELEGLKLPAEAAQFLFDGKGREAAEQETERAQRAGARVLSYSCPEYPERLKEIYDPPPVLWVRGDVRLLSRHSIAVVGTRQPTPYGSAMAEMLSRDLAARGMLILSGMARGIDSAAHRGAISANRPTAAIWGTGVDVVYPKENKKLAEEILAGGGVVASELPMGTFPAPQNFPRRNRILSGLSVGVLVVEAGERSGTRVTARCAAEQNRDVYAVPGNATSKNSWTPNTLIKQGAQLTASWEDVWEVLPSQIRLELETEWGVATFGESAASDALQPGLGANERIVLEALRQDEATQLDDLLDRLETQLSSSEVFTALFELEMAGRVRALPGKNYVRSF
jgi:DNA processing protein